MFNRFFNFRGKRTFFLSQKFVVELSFFIFTKRNFFPVEKSLFYRFFLIFRQKKISFCSQKIIVEPFFFIFGGKFFFSFGKNHCSIGFFFNFWRKNIADFLLVEDLFFCERKIICFIFAPKKKIILERNFLWCEEKKDVCYEGLILTRWKEKKIVFNEKNNERKVHLFSPKNKKEVCCRKNKKRKSVCLFSRGGRKWIFVLVNFRRMCSWNVFSKERFKNWLNEKDKSFKSHCSSTREVQWQLNNNRKMTRLNSDQGTFLPESSFFSEWNTSTQLWSRKTNT